MTPTEYVDSRISEAFADVAQVLPEKLREEFLADMRNSVKARWFQKVHDATPDEDAIVGETMLETELEQFLNEAIEEVYKEFVSP